MKYISLGISLAWFGLFVTGCKSSTSTATVTPPGSMIASVNGFAWSSTIVPGVSSGASGTLNGNAIQVTGISTSDNTQISLLIMNPALNITDSLGATGSTGKYSKILAASDTNAFLSIPDSGNLYAGAVTITAYDPIGKSISGSFHFTGRLADSTSDTATVMNGSFDSVSW